MNKYLFNTILPSLLNLEKKKKKENILSKFSQNEGDEQTYKMHIHIDILNPFMFHLYANVNGLQNRNRRRNKKE